VQQDLLSKLDMLWVFEDLIEISSESTLELLFEIFERHILWFSMLEEQGSEQSTVQSFQGKLQSMVSKICKIAIKKLSVTHDTQFRGKIQSFIAAAFPLAHPSGLNRSSVFN